MVIKTVDDCEQLYKLYRVENAEELAQKRETNEAEYFQFFTGYCQELQETRQVQDNPKSKKMTTVTDHTYVYVREFLARIYRLVPDGADIKALSSIFNKFRPRLQTRSRVVSASAKRPPSQQVRSGASAAKVEEKQFSAFSDSDEYQVLGDELKGVPCLFRGVSFEAQQIVVSSYMDLVVSQFQCQRPVEAVLYALVLLLKPRSASEVKADLLGLLGISDDVQGAQKLCQAKDWIRYVMGFGF